MSPSIDATSDPNAKERLAARLAAARAEYADAARAGRGGRDVQARYAGRLDDLIQTIVEMAGGADACPLAVCAVGGYGRRTLCLHSDVDLLIVFDGAIGRPEERFVNGLLHPLWDLRLTIGQHVRELSDFDDLDLGNPEFLLALLDLRQLAGDAAVFGRLRERLDAGGPARARPVLDELLSLVERRHDQFNHTFYQLEPDVKNAPGGLRDVTAVQFLRTLAPDAFHGAPDELDGQAGAAGSSHTERIDADTERLSDAEDFLMRIRSVLHLEAGRDANVLNHDLQEKVAEVLGYAGEQPQQRVEALMGEYFRHARAVSRGLEWARRIVKPPSEPITPRSIGRHLVLAADGIRFADAAKAASHPALWLEAFRVAIVRECPVSEQVQACVRQHVNRYTADDFVATEGERHQLRYLLYPREGLYARLSEMHDCGLLEAIFPEFARIHCRVIRDFYHKYTVDEHTLLTIRGLESLWNAPPARQRFGSILQEVHAPELLALSLLYHDVGKWRDEDHAQESVRMAQAMLERLQLAPDARQVVDFLIQHHLEMSRVAFRRDSEDPDVVARFAGLVGTEERLKMLCLMTLVDIESVSPDTLTPWKEDLLWRLYVDTYNQLTLGYADELIQKDQAGLAVVMAGRPDDISEAELSQFLDGLPRRYLAVFGLSTIYRHVRLARDIYADAVHAFLENHDDIWELSVVTLDKPYLFSNISGVLSYFGMDIHRGQAMTTPHGLVLDVFEFSDAERFLGQNPEATAQIYRMLEAVVAGTVDVTDLLRGKERSVVYRRRRRVAQVVNLDNAHSQKYTVVEIVADDAPGLLYRISRVFSRQGCDVDLVLISTEGKKAIDVLHVTKQGAKLSESDQAALKERLERTLEAGDETD